MSFLKSSILLAIWTVLSRISGFIRDSIMANYLGASVVSDALFAASKLPNSFRRLLAEGAMSSVFVPMFSKDLVGSKKDEAMIFANQIFTILFIVLVILVGIFELFMPFWIDILSPGFVANKEKFDLTVSLARINFVFLIAISLSAFCGGMLNSIYKFAYFAATPIIFNLGIVFVSIFCGNSPNLVYYISFATVFIGFITLLSLIFICYRNGLKVRFVPIVWNGKIRTFFSKMLNGLIGSGIYQVNIFVDMIFISWFAGGASYLYYTDRINQLPITLIGGTFGVALLPTISKFIKLNQVNEALKLQRECVLFGFFASTLCLISVLSLGEGIVSFVYKRGEFYQNDVEIVLKMLQILSFGLFFSVLSKIYNAFLFASGDTKSPMLSGLFCAIVNIVANIALCKSQGMFCVVYATLISSIFGGLSALYFVKKHKLYSVNFDLLKKIFLIALAGLVTFYFQKLLFNIAYKIFPLNSLVLLAILAISAAIYTALSLAFKIYTLQNIMKIFKKL